LQQASRRFEARGLRVISVSYDTTPILREFAADQKITFTMLADPSSKIIKAFDVVEQDNSPGNLPSFAPIDMAIPGFFIFDAQGKLVDKYIDESYDDRYTANNVLLRRFSDLAKFDSSTSLQGFDIRTGASDAEPLLGSRFTLFADITAPFGVQYQGLALELEAPANIRRKPVLGPKPGVFFSGRSRVSQDFVVPTTTEFLRAHGSGKQLAKPLLISGKVLWTELRNGEQIRHAAPVEFKLTMRLVKMMVRASPENQRKRG